MAVALLAVANLLNSRFAPSAYLLTSVLTAALLLGLLRLAGLGWEAAGLDPRALGAGLRWGLVLLAGVAAAYATGALLPWTRGIFLDRRVERATARTLSYETLVRIPFGTVLLEEVAFRGVLFGLVADGYGVARAAIVSSVLFGLWHVLPALELVKLNRTAQRVFAARRALVVPAAVLATTVAGLFLCELRRRTGSLAAPMTVHWATNALGYLTAYLVTKRRGAL